MSTEPISDTVRRVLSSQYGAALSTLEQCITRCDAETWKEPHLDSPVNQVVFHTLLFADTYLDWGEDDVRKQRFHRDNPELFQDYEEFEDREPVNFYRQDLCWDYLAHCRRKVDAVVAGETDSVLMGDCGFPRRKLTRMELHIYNIRHIQHHAAQLGLRFQLSGGEPLRWVGKG